MWGALHKPPSGAQRQKEEQEEQKKKVNGSAHSSHTQEKFRSRPGKPSLDTYHAHSGSIANRALVEKNINILAILCIQRPTCDPSHRTCCEQRADALEHSVATARPAVRLGSAGWGGAGLWDAYWTSTWAWGQLLKSLKANCIVLNRRPFQDSF